MNKRNYNIDFLRGCAFIFIVLIHTAWWSGQEYLPDWFSNLFLLIDVPIFIFISGLSYNYVESVGKNIKNILKQWNRWIFFLIFYVAITFIFFRSEFDLTKIVNYIFYGVPSEGSLKVVGGSLWFITVYIEVTILCSILLYFYNKYSKIEFKYILFFMILISTLNIDFIDSSTAIYSFVYLLGYYSYKNKFKSFKQFLLFELLTIFFVVFIFWISGYGIINLQDLKFPPTIYYLLASMPGILLTWFLKDKLKVLKNNFMCYLGKNAIFFYYSQGISSSLLFLIEPKIHIINIYIKFIVLVGINAVMAIVIGTTLNKLYNAIIKTRVI